ncbi:YceI family protein [Flavobacterium reichenbachii]|uniref:Lipid-binding protein n=1 Tax=Flavobacterium reichenbachii TaxID=362418 RepID=A0A085ZF33_9FLAO|nr:YceI family protein [Flavobacterium reichenbachii]KFF03047.1 lipid-binding protein [Flavobacterium reichenbachii]OXB17192.1 lipid-binding protein [Flavobacterium reichenbachii]
METQNFKIESAQSSVNWIGKKVTGAHNGTINIQEGNFTFANGDLIGGSIVIDTTSIVILDVTNPDTNQQFAGHLASDDFFSIEKFQTASLDITAVSKQSLSNYFVEGKLTIKGITNPIGFNLEAKTNGSELNASGKIIIDRTKYDMKFRSGNFFTNLGDTLIYNEFELDVNLTAKLA